MPLSLQISTSPEILVRMKLSDKQLGLIRARIAKAHAEKGISNAAIGRISGVHPSQVSRICSGRFKTLSYNVVQICKTLNVDLPMAEPRRERSDPSWAQVQSSIRKIWDETPQGAKAIAQMLEAILDLRSRS